MNPAELANLASTVNTLQTQLAQAQQNITNLQNELQGAKTAYDDPKTEISQLKNQISGQEPVKPKPRKPIAFTGKESESIISWVTHTDNFLGNTPGANSLNVASSYLDGHAHEWWIVHKQTAEGAAISTWSQFKDALVQRFQTLNKEKIARDKLAKWRQMKDIVNFNSDFQKIILDIPDISVAEQLDRYTRGLKPYIWKEMCTQDYASLTEAMRDAERIEAAHRRLRAPKLIKTKAPRGGGEGGIEPMDIGNIQLKKLTLAEREKCMKEGRCLRCREKGHLARNCPKAQGN